MRRAVRRETTIDRESFNAGIEICVRLCEDAERALRNRRGRPAADFLSEVVADAYGNISLHLRLLKRDPVKRGGAKCAV
jgi:hypothetical protein